MTEKNIHIMDIIVSKMVEGKTLSEALKLVYVKRKVRIPYDEKTSDVPITSLKMSNRTTNALMRNNIRSIQDAVKFCTKQKITEAKTFGYGCGIELFESILDYYWDHMSNEERTMFLIDTVERNSSNIRVELI
jgi:D-arabinose 1-dehydrogenase-like Zn-dependent alcohol dehydrogenase